MIRACNRPLRILRLMLVATAFDASAVGADAAVSYERDIKPLLTERCYSCHSRLKQKGDLRLDAGALIHKGGSDGPAVKAGRGSESEMVKRVTSRDEDEKMPPEGKPLTATQVELLKRWIDDGAKFPSDEVVPKTPAEHWAFQPVKSPAVPGVEDATWVRNPIDQFVLAALEQRGWKPSPRAESRALLRRVYLDLTGLPPTIAEQERFLQTQSLDAVIDDLLARPTYGERWARHWLDVVRYADSNGYERDAEKPFVWRYRDYVIASLNADKPFDRFVAEQIAGDQHPDSSAETMVATTYLRLGHWDDEPADPATDRFDQLDDIVGTIAQAFLGLTLGCARCHDHKFEPLATRDYYSMVAVFAGLERPREGRKELTVPVGSGDNGETQAYIWRESAKTPETHILIRGSASRPGDLVPPAVPAVLVKEQPQFPPQRRLGLARWIASEENPLTARVIVNRVWQQHFGHGLVRTANDFGLMGELPTHPELLDWLADWFVHDAHWSLKKLHRLILTSSTWQMTTHSNADYAVTDPDDRMLWRKPYRRLEVEAIRDSILAVSGRLNPKMFGPAMKPGIPKAAIEANTDKEKSWLASDETEASRRTIYAFIKRGLVVPMLEVLDLGDTVSSCPKRQTTTVAPQALTMFNGDFVNEQARHFAARLIREAGDDPRKQLQLAWRLALCREPSASELAEMLRFRERESLAEVCRVILNLNEFAYPE